MLFSDMGASRWVPRLFPRCACKKPDAFSVPKITYAFYSMAYAIRFAEGVKLSNTSRAFFTDL